MGFLIPFLLDLPTRQIDHCSIQKESRKKVSYYSYLSGLSPFSKMINNILSGGGRGQRLQGGDVQGVVDGKLCGQARTIIILCAAELIATLGHLFIPKCFLRFLNQI